MNERVVIAGGSPDRLEQLASALDARVVQSPVAGGQPVDHPSGAGPIDAVLNVGAAGADETEWPTKN